MDIGIVVLERSEVSIGTKLKNGKFFATSVWSISRFLHRYVKAWKWIVSRFVWLLKVVEEWFQNDFLNFSCGLSYILEMGYRIEMRFRLLVAVAKLVGFVFMQSSGWLLMFFTTTVFKVIYIVDFSLRKNVLWGFLTKQAGGNVFRYKKLTCIFRLTSLLIF